MPKIQVTVDCHEKEISSAQNDKQKSKCRVINCCRQSVSLLCEDHLRTPIIDEITFSKSISASPPIFAASNKLDTPSNVAKSMGSALYLISPNKLNLSRRSSKTLRRRLKASFEDNEKNLIVTRLQKFDTEANNFFAPSLILKKQHPKCCAEERMETSSEYKNICQSYDKHQLFLCSATNQVC